jgi:hypothetical protein
VLGSLVRLGRTARFRQAVKAMTATLDLDAGEFSAQLVAALAALAHSIGKDLTEPDWYRVLDALLLAAVLPPHGGGIMRRMRELAIIARSRPCDTAWCYPIR